MNRSITRLDMAFTPSPELKKQSCGKITVITLYSNHSVGVIAYRCHRWDCPDCRQERVNQIQNDIMGISKLWFARVISDDIYDATRKRIKRAGAVYCAVGRDDNVLMLTNQPVLEDSEILADDELAERVEQHLYGTYSHRRRRFRHTRGLIPNRSKPPSGVHIERKIAVGESAGEVIKKFENRYYSISGTGQGETYLRKLAANIEDAEEVICNDISNIEWVDSCPS